MYFKKTFWKRFLLSGGRKGKHGSECVNVSTTATTEGVGYGHRSRTGK